MLFSIMLGKLQILLVDGCSASDDNACSPLGYIPRTIYLAALGSGSRQDLAGRCALARGGVWRLGSNQMTDKHPG